MPLIKEDQKQLVHLNGNLLCVLDLETTGLKAGYHEIWQICVIPLDSWIRPLKGINPFYIELKPEKYENADPKALTKLKLAELVTKGINQFVGVDLFESWVKKLELPLDKKICPLAHNWPFDRSFLVEWLGWETFDSIFHPWYRDAMPVTVFLNDRANFKQETLPYIRHSLVSLTTRHKTENRPTHDAMDDCLATAELYRSILTSNNTFFNIGEK